MDPNEELAGVGVVSGGRAESWKSFRFHGAAGCVPVALPRQLK